jgi:hypothetical protein
MVFSELGMPLRKILTIFEQHPIATPNIDKAYNDLVWHLRPEVSSSRRGVSIAEEGHLHSI